MSRSPVIRGKWKRVRCNLDLVRTRRTPVLSSSMVMPVLKRARSLWGPRRIITWDRVRSSWSVRPGFRPKSTRSVALRLSRIDPWRNCCTEIRTLFMLSSRTTRLCIRSSCVGVKSGNTNKVWWTSTGSSVVIRGTCSWAGTRILRWRRRRSRRCVLSFREMRWMLPRCWWSSSWPDWWKTPLWPRFTVIVLLWWGRISSFRRGFAVRIDREEEQQCDWLHSGVIVIHRETFW